MKRETCSVRGRLICSGCPPLIGGFGMPVRSSGRITSAQLRNILESSTMFVNLQKRETILRRPVACNSIAVSLWVKVEAKRSKVST